MASDTIVEAFPDFIRISIRPLHSSGMGMISDFLSSQTPGKCTSFLQLSGAVVRTGPMRAVCVLYLVCHHQKQLLDEALIYLMILSPDLSPVYPQDQKLGTFICPERFQQGIGRDSPFTT